MSKKCDIGVIGLAVMGQNLVLNIEDSGYRVAGYNRTTSVTENFIKERAGDKDFFPAYDLKELVENLKTPRVILLMVKAGSAVDIIIDKLTPLLDKGDIIIDGGNSYFKDTDQRYNKLKEKDIHYLGVGISGGEYGALNGPSIMPGGDKKAYLQVQNILQDAAAGTEEGYCISYLGPRSAGHYVKMVHNGIEYGIMQVISEIYDIMRKIFKITPVEMSKLFSQWNQEHDAYLIEITSEILEKKDQETGKPLVDLILDRAKQKGTGRWSIQEGLQLGVPIPVITAAVNARYFSALKNERKIISGEIEKPDFVNPDIDIDFLKDALYTGIIVAYAEGIKLLQVASEEYEYNLDLAEVARIWGDGCIIRSSHLDAIQRAYQKDNDLLNLIIDPDVKKNIQKRLNEVRRLTAIVGSTGVPLPALNAALDSIDSLSSRHLPANIIQAQRDYFGAHTYQRIDKEGFFHTEW